METSEAVLQLATIQRRLTQAQPQQLRPSFPPMQLNSMRGAMIIGPRGTGKTTLMLSQAEGKELLYLSADNPLVTRFGIWELGNTALLDEYQGLAIDEVHYAKDWSTQVKALYDSFPNATLFASDSSSLVLRQGIADLSRRLPKVRVRFLSFREYLSLTEQASLPTLSFNAPTKELAEIGTRPKLLKRFKEYLSGGLRPFFLEGHYQDRMMGVIEKTIYTDVPLLLPSVQRNYLRVLNAIIGFLATSPIPTLNIEKLAGEWSIGKEKLYELLSILEHVELINVVRFKSDKKSSGKGAKIFLADPSMYSALGGNLGNLREAYVVCMARQNDMKIFACKDETKGDFELDGILVEVGGKTKHRKGAKLVIRDDLDVPSRNVIPLWSLGMAY